MESIYIFEGIIHSDISLAYMQKIGMNEEQIESVLNQKQFELSQNIERRKEAYIKESDPLFIEWKYDKTPESEQIWRNKVLEIKARYPIGAADA
ncbi:hypothetical protein ACROAK_06760 [Shewanella oncorhynchi]|uniref:hypothetical protein n=1 Tax=Shewanella oncorhynchi TaxID=2726434 RepID=UPI003D7BABA7